MKKSARRGRTHEVRDDGDNLEEDSEEPGVWSVVNAVGNRGPAPWMVDVAINGREVVMELDTGAARTLLSQATVDACGLHLAEVKPPSMGLRTYPGERIKTVGESRVEVCHAGQVVNLPLIVVEGTFPAVLGRDWLEKLRIDWRTVHRWHM